MEWRPLEDLPENTRFSSMSSSVADNSKMKTKFKILVSKHSWKFFLDSFHLKHMSVSVAGIFPLNFKHGRGQNTKISQEFHILIFHGKTIITDEVGLVIKVVENDLGYILKKIRTF